MNEKIQPALSAEAWGRALSGEKPDPAYTEDAFPENLELREAALFLYRCGADGTPWFTQADVGVLGSAIEAVNADGSDSAARLRSLAARIAALLPPPEKP